MTNKYGTPLDQNGYALSIMPDHGPRRCYLCGRTGDWDPLNRHEIFFGVNRRKSKELGLWVYLCHNGCHQGPHGVHTDRRLDLMVKARAQRRAMEVYGWTVEDFRAQFGKSWI